jgi:hypothetical protein
VGDRKDPVDDATKTRLIPAAFGLCLLVLIWTIADGSFGATRGAAKLLLATVMGGVATVVMLRGKRSPAHARQAREDDRARQCELKEILAREPPPRPGAAPTTAARFACGSCGELNDADTLETIGNRRVCPSCAHQPASETEGPYR